MYRVFLQYSLYYNDNDNDNDSNDDDDDDDDDDAKLTWQRE